ncbi:MAG: hypothetical protein REJ23_00960 [Brevundimonas sp.]|nr:hypothetical protein [Brevundimonas sp.]
MPDPAHLKAIIEAELQHLTHPQATTAIRAHLVEPVSVTLDWDYGAPSQQFPGWLVFDDPTTDTEIVFCADGFGPSHPWGLILPEGDHRPMGMDSGWYRTFLGAWSDLTGLEPGSLIGHGPADV